MRTSEHPQTHPRRPTHSHKQTPAIRITQTDVARSQPYGILISVSHLAPYDGLLFSVSLLASHDGVLSFRESTYDGTQRGMLKSKGTKSNV